MVITDSIKGDNYHGSSEWSKFRILDSLGFWNLEKVEIWTDQDIPDVDVEYEDDGYYIETQRGLFYCDAYDDTLLEYVNI